MSKAVVPKDFAQATGRSDRKEVVPIVAKRAVRRRYPQNAGGSIERLRQTIRTSMLLTLLEDVADGTKQADPHQVTAAVALLRKVLPDLQATMISMDPARPLTIITRCE